MTPTRMRGAEIVAAVMKAPRTVRELAEAIGAETTADKVRVWAEEYRKSGVFYVKGYRRCRTSSTLAKVYALQPAVFAQPDATREVTA